MTDYGINNVATTEAFISALEGEVQLRGKQIARAIRIICAIDASLPEMEIGKAIDAVHDARRQVESRVEAELPVKRWMINQREHAESRLHHLLSEMDNDPSWDERQQLVRILQRHGIGTRLDPDANAVGIWNLTRAAVEGYKARRNCKPFQAAVAAGVAGHVEQWAQIRSALTCVGIQPW